MPTANEPYYGTYTQAVVSDPSGTALDTGNNGAEQSSSFQLGTVLGKSSVSTDVSANIYIAPFIADLYADASGSVGVLQQQTVLITGIDSIFDVTATVGQAKKLVKCFEVLEMNNLANPTAWAAYDASAHIVVNMAENAGTVADFKSALGEIIANDASLPSAQNNGHASAETLYKYLKHEAHRDTVDIMSYDGLADMLEASDLLSFDISVDASQGANSMYSKLHENNGVRGWYDTAGTIEARRRRAMFTQLPQANIQAYATASNGTALSNEHATKMSFLPLLKGDTIVFVFDVTVGRYTISGTAPTAGATIGRIVADEQFTSVNGTLTDPSGGIVSAAAAAGAVESDYSIGDLLFTAPTKRRVALKVKVDVDAGAAAGDLLGATELVTGSYTDQGLNPQTEFELILV